MEYYLITPMVFLPLLGAVLQIFLPAETRVGQFATETLGRWIAMLSSLAASVFAFALLVMMDAEPGLQASEVLPWIGSYSISYDMAIDGLNILPVLLVGILFPVLIAAEWGQKQSPRGIYSLLLILQAALFGTVCAQDAFLQLVFWGLSALPLYFLVGIWGGDDRERVAFRGIVSAALGNVLFFAALLLVYYAVDPHTFSLRELAGGKFAGKNVAAAGLELDVGQVALALMAFGLALRTPIWPFHGWFTQVAGNSPPSIGVAHSITGLIAVFLFIKSGLTLFPETMKAVAPIIVLVGGVNLFAGGLCAVAQKDLRGLIAYLSIAEFGLLLIGVGSLTAQSLVGTVYQLLIFGLGIGGLGLFAAIISHRTSETRILDDQGERMLGGVVTKAPALAFVTAVSVATVLGFPGSGGFVGHALIALGSFSVYPAAIILIGGSALLGTYYLFTMYRLVFLGKTRGLGDGSGFTDLTRQEKSYLFPLVLASIGLGIYPKPLLDLVAPTVLKLLESIR